MKVRLTEAEKDFYHVRSFSRRQVKERLDACYRYVDDFGHRIGKWEFVRKHSFYYRDEAVPFLKGSCLKCPQVFKIVYSHQKRITLLVYREECLDVISDETGNYRQLGEDNAWCDRLKVLL